MNKLQFAEKTFWSSKSLEFTWICGLALLILLSSQASAFGQNVFDSRVFDWRFYVNANADLLRAGINNPAAAQNHWLYSGINEGRQAHPAFHARQYLDQYADLRNAFGAGNFRAVLNHYLIAGFNEGRRGYIEGGAYGRWTIRNPYITVSGSQRQAGAVDSIFWNGRELINSYDHGREVQMAVNKNPYGECFNPTEAGSLNDNLNSTSTSILYYATSGSNWFYTQNRPAYWLLPGQINPNPNNPCGAGRGANPYSDYFFVKTVEMSPAGLPLAISYRMQVYVPENIHPPEQFQLQAPAGFVAGDLTDFYSYNPANGSFYRLPGTPGTESDFPVIASTPDGRYAYGTWVNPRYVAGASVRYGYGNGGYVHPAWHYNYLIPVIRINAVNQGTWVSPQTFISVGSLDNVRVTISQLHSLSQAGVL